MQEGTGKQFFNYYRITLVNVTHLPVRLVYARKEGYHSSISSFILFYTNIFCVSTVISMLFASIAPYLSRVWWILQKFQKKWKLWTIENRINQFNFKKKNNCFLFHCGWFSELQQLEGNHSILAYCFIVNSIGDVFFSSLLSSWLRYELFLLMRKNDTRQQYTDRVVRWQHTGTNNWKGLWSFRSSWRWLLASFGFFLLFFRKNMEIIYFILGCWSSHDYLLASVVVFVLLDHFNSLLFCVTIQWSEHVYLLKWSFE
jgi:hypothetical protein